MDKEPNFVTIGEPYTKTDEPSENKEFENKEFNDRAFKTQNSESQIFESQELGAQEFENRNFDEVNAQTKESDYSTSTASEYQSSANNETESTYFSGTNYTYSDSAQEDAGSSSSAGYDSNYSSNYNSNYSQGYNYYGGEQGNSDNNFGYQYENSSYGFSQENPGSFQYGKKPKREKKPSPYVTRKTLIISLICCMIVTSVATAFAVSYFSGGSKSISATNYTLAKATGSEKSIEEIVAMNENAVVEVRTEQVSTGNRIQNYVSEGAGSGVIIDSNGYILTCNHVIENATNITVTLKNGKSYTASVVGADPKTDVAVIKITGKGFTAAQYGDVKDLSVGDLAVAIGNPLGELGGSASTGIISSLSRQLTIDGQTMTLLQTDASINPGNSGGGLFDGYGNLIGIVVAKSSGSDIEGLGFAIPINKAAEIAKELIENGKVTGRAMMGIKILDATDNAVLAQYNLDEPGVYVASLDSIESQDAGLKIGDMFFSMDGKKIDSSADISSVLEDHKPGDKVKVVVIRNGEKVNLTLTLIEAQ